MPASIGGYRWHAALDELTALRTWIAPDPMGLGFTEARAGQDMSFEAQALAAFLDCRAIGLRDSLGWVGQSHDRAARQVLLARRTSAPADGAAQGILGKRKLEQGADGARGHVCPLPTTSRTKVLRSPREAER